MRDFFTVSELARHFGVNPKTIYRRLWAKGIPAYKVGRRWRIARKDIIWLKRQELIIDWFIFGGCNGVYWNDYIFSPVFAHQGGTGIVDTLDFINGVNPFVPNSLASFQDDDFAFPSCHDTYFTNRGISLQPFSRDELSNRVQKIVLTK